MLFKKIILKERIGILFFIFLQITSQTVKAQEQKIYIDPKAAISTSVGQLFSAVEFIPLETTRQSIINRPSAMVVTDKYYIILDRTQSSVLFFNKAGKFLSLFREKDYEITDLKFVPIENVVWIQTRKRGYAYTEEQKYELILHNTGYYDVWTCDLNNPVYFEFNKLKNFNYAGYTLYPISGKEFLASAFFSDYDFPDKLAYELQYIKNGKVTASFFPYNEKDFTPYYNLVDHISFFKSFNDSFILFTRPYRYEISGFENGKIKQKYSLIFPASQSLPSDFFQKDLSTETSWEILKKKYQGAVQNILPVMSWDNHLIFWLQTLQPNNMRDFRQYLLDLKSNTLINAAMIKPDSVSYNLSINFTGLMAQDATSVYTFMFADEFIAASASGRTEDYPAPLKVFFEQNNSNANPIIVRLTKK